MASSVQRWSAFALLATAIACAQVRAAGPGSAAPGDPTGFRRPRPVVVQGLPDGPDGTPISTEEPFVSRDGQFLFFNTAQHENNKDLHYAAWSGSEWAYRGEIGPGINNARNVQGNPSMDREGSFFFVDSGVKAMLRVGRFRPETGHVEDIRDLTGVPSRQVRLFAQKFHGNMGVEVSADGEIIFFSRATWDMNGLALGRMQASELLFTRKQGGQFVYDESEARRVMARINTADLEYAASISADGLELYFTRLPAAALASRKIRSQIMRAVRSSRSEPFEAPHAIAAIGDREFVEGPAVTPDGRTLYYHRRQGKKFRLYKVTR